MLTSPAKTPIGGAAAIGIKIASGYERFARTVKPCAKTASYQLAHV